MKRLKEVLALLIRDERTCAMIIGTFAGYFMSFMYLILLPFIKNIDTASKQRYTAEMTVPSSVYVCSETTLTYEWFKQTGIPVYMLNHDNAK